MTIPDLSDKRPELFIFVHSELTARMGVFVNGIRGRECQLTRKLRVTHGIHRSLWFNQMSPSREMVADFRFLSEEELVIF
jgi:hypothetical protein